MNADVDAFEDLVLNEERPMGTLTFGEDEIIAFAERYDPLPFHTDPQRAEASIFGGLIASGFQTTLEANRLLVENFFRSTTMQGALGIDELRWHEPVRPGDELTVTGSIVDTEGFNDALGLGRGRVVVRNETDEVVLTMLGLLLFGRRSRG